MATIGNAPVFPTESVLPGNLEVTGNATVSGNATISGTTNSVGNLTENSNDVITTESNVAPKVPVFRARQLDSVAQLINSGVNTKMLFATEDFDTASFYDPSTSRFTPTIAGYYFLTTSVRTDTPVPQATSRFDCNFYIDGSASTYGGGLMNASDKNAQCFGSALIYLDGTQYVEVYVDQNSGANVTINSVDNAGGTDSIVYFQGFLVHAT